MLSWPEPGGNSGMPVVIQIESNETNVPSRTFFREFNPGPCPHRHTLKSRFFATFRCPWWVYNCQELKRDAALHNEKILLEQLRTGDEAAFTQLYNTYSGPLLVNLLTLVKDEHVAEEIVQNIFTRLWQKRATLQVEQQLSSYLYRAARNGLIDFYRKLQRDKALYDKFAALANDTFFHIEETLQEKENAALLQKAMDSLPPQQRKVFQLCKLDGLTAREAALQLGISPYTVNEYLAKARLSLRNAFLDNQTNVSIGLLLLWICL